MRTLIEEYGMTMFYIITGCACISIFCAAFFGNNSAISGSIEDGLSNRNSETVIQYNITYDLDGGYWSEGKQIPLGYTMNESIVLPVPEKEGYLFAGWIGSRLSSPTTIVHIPRGSTGNRSYKAVWTKGHYWVRYDLNLDSVVTTYSDDINDYNKLEYVRFNGTGYFDTGVEISSNIILDYDVSFDYADNKEGTLIGGIYSVWRNSDSQYHWNDYFGMIANYMGGGTFPYFFGSSWKTFENKITKNVFVNVLQSYQNLKIDNEVLNYSSKSGRIDEYEGDNIYVGGRMTYAYSANYELSHIAITNNTYFIGKLKSLRIYENGTVVRNYVPVQSKEGAVGLFDTVSNTFITGSYMHAGPTIEGDPIKSTYMTNLEEYGVYPTIPYCDYQVKHYSFLEWNTKKDGSGTRVPVGTYTRDLIEQTEVHNTTDEITLYAQWSKTPYRITYKLDGGNNNPANKAVYFIDTETFTILDPSRTGYTFKGWVGTNAAVPTKNIVIPKGSTGDREFFAIWEANRYTVSFNAVGGSVSPESKAVDFGSKYGTLPIPEYPGYDFIGWYDSATGGNKINEESIVETPADHTLYARWQAHIYTVSYDANGGSVSPASKNVEYFTAYGILAVPVRTDYEFLGWFTAPEDGEEIIAETIYTLTTDTTIYAQWKQKTKLTLNLEGGTYACSEGTLNDGVCTIEIDAEDLPYSLPKPTKSNVAFAGWYNNDSGTGTKYLIWTSEDSATLYAYYVTPTTNISNASSVQSYTVPVSGVYQLEVWGAKGGRVQSSWGNSASGGQGGYTKTYAVLEQGDVLYIATGGVGPDSVGPGSWYDDFSGGWNGGCGGGKVYDWDAGDYNNTGGGGGATHIALNSNRGVLTKYANNQDEILVVAGGGAGAVYRGANSGTTGAYAGGNGGGTGGGESGSFGSAGGGRGYPGGGGGGWEGGRNGNWVGSYFRTAYGGTGYYKNETVTYDGSTYTSTTTNGGNNAAGKATITFIK